MRAWTWIEFVLKLVVKSFARGEYIYTKPARSRKKRERKKWPSVTIAFSSVHGSGIEGQLFLRLPSPINEYRSLFSGHRKIICMPCQSISSISENQQRYLARIRENRLFYIFFRAMIFFFLFVWPFTFTKKKKKTIRLVFVIKGPIGAISFPEFRLRRSRSDLFVG